MEKNRIDDFMEITMSKIREMVDANTVVGTPISTPDGLTMIPVSKINVGFAAGGSDFPIKEKDGFGGGNGVGMKIEPVGFLVVKDGSVRMINIAPPADTTLDRLIELAPQIIDKVEELIKNRREEE